MRLQEFASAEEQMALWRLVTDSVWASISQQAEQERRESAAKAAQAKTKRKSGSRVSSKSSSAPVAIKMPKPPNSKVATATVATAATVPTAANTAPVGNATANANAYGQQKTGGKTNAADKFAANSSVATTPTTTAQPSTGFSAAQPATPTVAALAMQAVPKASSGSQDAFNWRNSAVHKKLPAATDRHSVNGYRTQPVHASARGAITR